MTQTQYTKFSTVALGNTLAVISITHTKESVMVEVMYHGSVPTICGPRSVKLRWDQLTDVDLISEIYSYEPVIVFKKIVGMLGELCSK